ncbi:MAG TPA: plastocyanin/azurin family copper-binding protein [Egibacteraceae bacterium]|nr:plastocyanin/azurin family copper-binding protein [Egibacteraceae bacterium]
MNNDFRQRVFLPIMLPLGVIIGFFGFAFMLSRVLLAVEEMAATAIALGLATYILAVAAVVAAKPRITSRALGVGVTLGVLAIVGAGTVAAAAGMRDLHHTDGQTPPAVGDQATQELPTPGAVEAESDQLMFVAVDIDFSQAPESAPAGDLTITLTNEGQALHNVTIPDLQDTPIVEATAGETASDIVTLEPGTYEYLCSVPGHESLMNGEFTVE